MIAAPSQPNIDTGGSGSGGFDPTPSFTPAGPSNLVQVPISGGLNGSAGVVAFPLVDNQGNVQMQYFDTSTFDCEDDATLAFRQEEVNDGSKITIKKIKIKYRNLGRCVFILTVQGMFDNVSKTVILGDATVLNGEFKPIEAVGDGKLYNAYIDLVFTDEAPQLIITRAANSGPISLISMVAYGDIHQEKE